MAKYYLHLHNSHGEAEDEEGIEAHSLAAAREVAITGIRDLMSSEAKNGAINLTGRIDITDGMGKVLVQIPFASALKVIGP
jgi:hypothetical protein